VHWFTLVVRVVLICILFLWHFVAHCFNISCKPIYSVYLLYVYLLLYGEFRSLGKGHFSSGMTSGFSPHAAVQRSDTPAADAVGCYVIPASPHEKFAPSHLSAMRLFVVIGPVSK